jgi:hypothetical protein
LVVLATQTPPTRVLPGPQAKAAGVARLSSSGSGAGDMACAGVAMVKAKAATAINLIIRSLPCLSSSLVGFPYNIALARS